MKQDLKNSQPSSIYDYDDRIERTYKLIESEFSKENAELIKKYDRSMISESLAKARSACLLGDTDYAVNLLVQAFTLDDDFKKLATVEDDFEQLTLDPRYLRLVS